jgi:hypothetical protein
MMIEFGEDDAYFDDSTPGQTGDDFWYVDRAPLTAEQTHAEKLRDLLADISLDASLAREDERLAHELRGLPVTVERTVAIVDAEERRRAALSRIAKRNIEVSELD